MKQNLWSLAAAIGLFAGMAAGAQTKVDASIPHLENRGGTAPKVSADSAIVRIRITARSVGLREAVVELNAQSPTTSSPSLP